MMVEPGAPPPMLSVKLLLLMLRGWLNVEVIDPSEEQKLL